jgi:hypothetical protein
MTTDMTRTIKIVSVDENASTAGCGGAEQAASEQRSAAGIDTDIFEADSLGLGGERFWEAFWRTQLTYGGVSAGQSLALIFANLPDEIFSKLREDIERLHVDHLNMPDAEKDDIFGMLIFLTGMERGDPAYDPIEREGYESTMARLALAISQEVRRRAGAAGA